MHMFRYEWQTRQPNKHILNINSLMLVQRWTNISSATWVYRLLMKEEHSLWKNTRDNDSDDRGVSRGENWQRKNGS